MPPPATVYGHLAGVLGEWFSPEGLRFAYTFRHEGKDIDVETGQPLERGSGRNSLKKRGWDYPVNVECAPNPQRREFLLKPRLTLYLAGQEDQLRRFQSAFLSPAFAYVIGRSQDLATCRSVELVTLEECECVFFSHTILPYEWRPWILQGTSVLMPSSIDYMRQREAIHTRYLQVTWPPIRVFTGSPDAISGGGLPRSFDADTSEEHVWSGGSLPRGLYFHPLAGPGIG